MKIQELQNKINQSLDHFKEELGQLRTGRADAGLIENIEVNAYEGSSPLRIRELATINVVDTKLLVVEPFDKSITDKVSKAISNAGVGLNPTVDGNSIKVPVPDLNEEQRRNYVKLAKEKLEEARIAIRNIRKDAIKSVEEREENEVISEDEMNLEKRQIEAEIKRSNDVLDEVFNKKEVELMQV